VKELIDELYWKEKKYVRQYIRDDYIGPHDFIFDLGKTHSLKLAKGKEKRTDVSEELMITNSKPNKSIKES
jgi:hypothetical protein